MLKKILMFGIPVVFAGGLLAAAGTYGFHSHHHGVAKDFMEYRLDKLSKELNLTPAQQTQMDGFKKDLESMMDQRMEKHHDVRQAIKEELSKDNPDLTKVKPLIDQQIDDMAQLGHDLTGRVTDFYGQLTPDQKRIVTNMIMDHMNDRENSDRSSH